MRSLFSLLTAFLFPERSFDGYDGEPVALPPAPTPAEVAVEKLPPRRVFGAWAGRWSLAHPEQAVELCTRLGINRVDIIVNDWSTMRKEADLDGAEVTYDADDIVRLADTCHAAGIEVHFMSWVMPFRGAIKKLGAALRPIIERAKPASICWDLEEPLTQAKKNWNKDKTKRRIPWADVPALVRAEFGSIPFGFTGIRYASKQKLGPWVPFCAYAMPQCYATKSSSADPSTVVELGVKRYIKLFGESIVIVPAAAAYRQTGIKGHKPQSAMLAVALDAEEVHPNDHVVLVWWYLLTIMRSPSISRAVATITRQDGVK